MCMRISRIRLITASFIMVMLSAWVSGAYAGVEMKPGSAFSDGPGCPEMVAISAGSFEMGTDGDTSATPVHRVTLDYQFAIGKTEITEAQFRFFLQRTGYNAGPGHLKPSFSPRLPAVDLDWYDASAYVRWLSRHTGKRYRLPSEAEWEFAARAGTSSRYWWGDSIADACGREHVLSTFFPYDMTCATLQNRDVIEVASLPANPWGLYDMQGNAGEWTLDCPPVDSSNYTGAPMNGSPFTGCGLFSYGHIVRGPDFINDAAPRRRADPTERSARTGFRVVRELP